MHHNVFNGRPLITFANDYAYSATVSHADTYETIVDQYVWCDSNFSKWNWLLNPIKTFGTHAQHCFNPISDHHDWCDHWYHFPKSVQSTNNWVWVGLPTNNAINGLKSTITVHTGLPQNCSTSSITSHRRTLENMCKRVPSGPGLSRVIVQQH